MGYMHQRLFSAGQRKHKLILDQAIEMASTWGLQGVTFGRLAESLRMSKSGLFVHFGSKEELQLEALDTVWKRFNRRLGFECMEVERGAPLLRAMAKGWLSFLSRRRTGAFLLSVGFEFDDLTGRIHSSVGAYAKLWAESLEGEVQAGIERDHFKPRVTPQALAFEIHGIAHTAYGLADSSDEKTLGSVRGVGSAAPYTIRVRRSAGCHRRVPSAPPRHSIAAEAPESARGPGSWK